jgi:hypothetical protein
MIQIVFEKVVFWQVGDICILYHGEVGGLHRADVHIEGGEQLCRSILRQEMVMAMRRRSENLPIIYSRICLERIVR